MTILCFRLKVLKNSNSAFVKVFAFQVDCYGKIEIEIQDCPVGTLGEPCTKRAFDNAWEKVIAKIQKYVGSIP